MVRVVAASDPSGLREMLAAAGSERCAVWVNALDELDSSALGVERLAKYAEAVREASSRGQRPFDLYGGFFAVLLSTIGLRGASHGIGYGEARDWHELPQSGPPPARYYAPRLHRYVSMDLAVFLWRTARTLIVCDCVECEGDSPGRLDYHVDEAFRPCEESRNRSVEP